MDRYPPYRTLLITLIVVTPVFLFLIFNSKGDNDRLLSFMGLDEYTGVSPVPVSVFNTRKGPDLPVPLTGNESIGVDSLGVHQPDSPPQKLEFPAGDTSILFPIYQKLLSVPSDSTPFNILHFGDSQLEEDRITQYFRYKLNAHKFPFATKGLIRVINLPKRGSAGIDLLEVGGQPLQEIFSNFPPDLIIFEFGINVVRAKTHNFGYYTKALVKQINRFRELCYEVPVLIISVSDMADRSQGGITPLETVPWVCDAQREAARLTSSVFWDLLRGMGGPGSVISWYQHDPPLIREDLTHFSFSGGERIADDLFQALIWDIWKFERLTP